MTFFKYCALGAIAALFELGTFYVMIKLMQINYIFSSPIAFVIAITINYILQRKITFKNTYSKKRKQFAVFLIIALGGLLINWSATIIYVEIAHIAPMIAKLGAILTALIYNYTMNKRITFAKFK